MAWLSDQLGADRVSTRGEAEKLALYAGPGGRVDLDAAMACVGDLAGLSLDDALFAATEGDVARADRALELALAEGATPVGVLRAGLMHLQRLHRVRLAVDEGLSAADAVKGARPPVFFRRVGRVQPGDRAVALGRADGGDGRAGGGGTRLQAHRRAGRRAVAQRGAGAGAPCRGRRGKATKRVSAVTIALLCYYCCSPILLSKLSN